MEDKTKEQLTAEIESLCRGVAELEQEKAERKRAEEALKESEQKYRFLVENLDEIILVLSRKGKILFANKKAVDASGYPKEQLVGQSILKFLTKDSVAKAFYALVQEFLGRPQPMLQVKIKTRSGEIRDLEIAPGSAPVYEKEKQIGILINGSDITERKRAEEALRASEQNFRSSLDNSPLGIRIVSAEGETLYVNQAILDIYGYSSLEELEAVPRSNRYTPESYVEHQERKEKRKLGKFVPPHYEISIVRKDGEVRQLEVFRRVVMWGGETQFQVIYHDITEQKEARSKLQELEALESSILGAVPHAVIGLHERRIVFANKGVEAVFGWKPEELIGKTTRVLYRSEEEYEEIARRAYPALERQQTYSLEFPCRRKDGRDIICLVSDSRIGESLKERRIVVTYEDITGRKRVEEEIKRRASQAVLGYEVSQRVSSKLELDELLSEIVTAVRDAFDYYGVMILLVDEEAQRLTMQSIAGGYADIFPRDLYHAIGEGMTGYAAASGKTQVSGNVSKDPHYVREADEETKSELAVPSKRGQKVIGVLDIQSDEFDAFDEADVMLMETLADQIAVAIENARLYEAVQQELAERKQAEEEVKYQKKYFQSLFENSPEAVVSLDIQNRIVDLNPVFEKMFGYKLEDIKGKDIDDYIIPRSRKKEGRSLSRRTWEGEVVVAESIRKRADGVEIPVSILGAPIMIGDKRVGMFAIYRDITERKKAQEQLENSFIDLAETVSRAMESRDPYTSGHQRRVAELARLVGEKMGLDKNRLQGLYIGGLLHDIGKVSTPESILAKPGRLSDEEWSLIHAHTKQGYLILKDTNLPWPVADMALHHHERLDGSGYPHGISGDKLSLEVRILGVCDVVEAMSSHRPYRPARSIAEILRELRSGRGTKYAPDVVDVMLEIIEGGEFELSGGQKFE